MARKSSKTAHVMNLLAGDDSESPKSEAAKENIAASLTTELGGSIKELTVMAQQASIQTQDGPLTPSPISCSRIDQAAPGGRGRQRGRVITVRTGDAPGSAITFF